MTTTRYQAEVVAVIPLCVDGTSPEDAEREARRVACARPWLTSAHIVDVTVSPLTSAQQLARDNFRLWQEAEALKLGTASQRERWAAGCLPDEELLLLVRDHLFRPFSLFERRRKRAAAQCARDGADLRFATLDEVQLTAAQWQTVQRIRQAVHELDRHVWLRGTGAVRASIREHRSTCPTCEATVSDYSTLVQIVWAERTLSREYAL